MWIIYLILICLVLAFFGGHLLAFIIAVIPITFIYYILDKLGASEGVTYFFLIIVSIAEFIFILIKMGKLTITNNKKSR